MGSITKLLCCCFRDRPVEPVEPRGHSYLHELKARTEAMASSVIPLGSFEARFIGRFKAIALLPDPEPSAGVSLAELNDDRNYQYVISMSMPLRQKLKHVLDMRRKRIDDFAAGRSGLKSRLRWTDRGASIRGQLAAVQ